MKRLPVTLLAILLTLAPTLATAAEHVAPAACPREIEGQTASPPTTTTTGAPTGTPPRRPGNGSIRLGDFSAPMRRFIEKVINPLLEEKRITEVEPYRELTHGEQQERVMWSGSQHTLRIHTPRGTYTFLINGNTVEDELGQRPAALNVLNAESPEGLPWPRLEGSVFLHPRWLLPTPMDDPDHIIKLQGLARSAFRGDEYLHPHQHSPWYSGPTFLSHVQHQEVDRAANMYNRHLRSTDPEHDKPFRIAEIAPGGSGKTVWLAHYLRRTHINRWPDNNPITVVTVQETDILEQTADRLAAEFGLQPNQVVRKFGRHSDAPITADTRLVVTTRSTFFNRRTEIAAALRGRRAAVAFDEAHHVGAVEQERPEGATGANQTGQFQKILEALEAVLTKQDQFVFLSATLWHDDTDIIRQIVGNNVLGLFLTDTELRQLRRGQGNVPLLAWAQLVRGIRRGYLCPFPTIRRNQIAGDPDLDDLDENLRAGSGAEVAAIPAGLLRQLHKDLRESRSRLRVPHRAIIYGRRTQRLTRIRNELRTRFAGTDIDETTELRAYHTGEHADDDALDWFRRTGTFTTPTRAHLVLLVDGMVNEGVDIRSINAIFLVKTFRALLGSRELLQNITRGARTDGGKVLFHVYAYGQVFGDDALLSRIFSGVDVQTRPTDDPTPVIDDEERERPARPERDRDTPPPRRAIIVNDRVVFDEDERPATPVQTPPTTAGPGGGPDEGTPTPPPSVSGSAAPATSSTLLDPEPVGPDRGDVMALLAMRSGFGDHDAVNGSALARQMLEMMDRVAAVPVTQVLHIRQIKGQRAGRAVDAFRRLLGLGARFRWNERQQVSTGNADYMEELAELCRAENRRVAAAILTEWARLRSILAGAPEKAVRQVAVVSMRAEQGNGHDTHTVQLMLDMYKGYAEARGWTWRVSQETRSTRPSRTLTRVVLEVTGDGALDELTLEAGRHELRVRDGESPVRRWVDVVVLPPGVAPPAVTGRAIGTQVRRYDTEGRRIARQEAFFRGDIPMAAREGLIEPLPLQSTLSAANGRREEQVLTGVLPTLQRPATPAPRGRAASAAASGIDPWLPVEQLVSGINTDRP